MRAYLVAAYCFLLLVSAFAVSDAPERAGTAVYVCVSWAFLLVMFDTIYSHGAQDPSLPQ